MYSAKSHLEDVVESFKPCNTDCKIIDGDMNQLLQFIDTHIKKSLKHIVRQRWADWIAKQDKRRSSFYEIICQGCLKYGRLSSADFGSVITLNGKMTIRNFAWYCLTQFFIKLFQKKLRSKWNVVRAWIIGKHERSKWSIWRC